MAILVGLGVAGFPSAPLSTSANGILVAAYGFDEGSGATVADVSGSGNDGSIVNAARTSDGLYGGALSFDGSSARVLVPDSASLHLGSDMTLEAWVKPSTAGAAWQDVIHKGSDDYFLDAASPTGYPAAGGIFGGAPGTAYGDEALPARAWTHLALTYNGSKLRLFVDGSRVAAVAANGPIASSNSPLEIGGDGILGQFFQGLIDEVRIYDVARSQAQIRSDMVTPLPAPPPDTEPPSKPASLVASASGSNAIGLSWDAATDDRGVTGYQIERCTGTGCSDFSHLADTTDTSYSDGGLTASTEYSYRVRASDAAGNLSAYSDPASATTAAAPPAGVGLLRVGPSGRYLVDQNGTPFLITGESPQAMIGDLTEADAAAFFAKRASQGFNTVWINLLCNSYTGCNSDGTTWDGVQPFTTPGDLSTPNEAYFARADRILQLAQQYGFVVLLDPIETGGWLGTMVANGVTKDRDFGHYLGARYKGFPNIIWMSGNDYQDWGPTYDPYVTAVAQGIADNDPDHLQTVELNSLNSGSLDDPAWAPLIQLDAAYTYDPTYKQVLTEYNRPSPLPTFMVEATYEFEQNTPNIPYGSPLQLRKQEYWSLLSGAAGQMYGNRYTWQFLCPNRDAAGNCIGGWKDQLDSTGATQMAYVTGLFVPRKWYDLVPDQTHSVVTDGLGTFGADDYVTAARTPDGTLAMAYVPSSRTITVDLSTLGGSVTARWYDPTNGTFTSIAGSPFPNVGSVQFATPATNAGGDGDWVLVLEASAS